MTTNLRDAITAYQADAAAAFDAAHNAINATPTPTGKDLTTDQGNQAAAFSQLSAAATMTSAQDGRDGYLSVVSLMASVATTATTLCTALTTAVANATPNYQLIGALTNALQALAQLSPAAVWEKPTSSASS